MRIKFKSTQGGKEGFQINQEYEMDEKSARHWINLGSAVEVKSASSKPEQQAPQKPGTPS